MEKKIVVVMSMFARPQTIDIFDEKNDLIESYTATDEEILVKLYESIEKYSIGTVWIYDDGGRRHADALRAELEDNTKFNFTKQPNIKIID